MPIFTILSVSFWNELKVWSDRYVWKQSLWKRYSYHVFCVLHRKRTVFVSKCQIMWTSGQTKDMGSVSLSVCFCLNDFDFPQSLLGLLLSQSQLYKTPVFSCRLSEKSEGFSLKKNGDEGCEKLKYIKKSFVQKKTLNFVMCVDVGYIEEEDRVLPFTRSCLSLICIEFSAGGDLN